jgi:hypothetical protein
LSPCLYFAIRKISETGYFIEKFIYLKLLEVQGHGVTYWQGTHGGSIHGGNAEKKSV